MSWLPLERYCDEIVAQTELLRSHARGAEMTTRVPSCPEWNLGQLLRHLGGAHRWVETIIATRAQEEVSDDIVNDVGGYTDEDGVFLDGWLAAGAERLAETLLAAGPDISVWTVAPDQPMVFWARRMTHETVLHRFDVAYAVGGEFTVAPDLTANGFEEWLTHGTSPEAVESKPGIPDLLGAGRTLAFEATDTGEEWLVDLTGEEGAWRRGGGRGAVTMRGGVTDLLLCSYSRPGARDRVEVTGDVALLEEWLARASFWLEEEPEAA